MGQWQALVATLEQALCLHRHRPGDLLKLDAYLHERTDGMIGSLSHLVRGAATEAILDGSEAITKATLEPVRLDHAPSSLTASARRRGAPRPASFMSPLPLHRLPVPLTPFPGETLGSYLARLAVANHLEQATLAGCLREPGAPSGAADLRRLTATTGKPSLALQHALPELGPYRLWLRGEEARLACRSCVAARGISGPVRPSRRLHPPPALDRSNRAEGRGTA